MYLIANDPGVISGYPKAILTPNGGEFPTFYEKMVLSSALMAMNSLVLIICGSFSKLGEKIQSPSDSNRAQEETKCLAMKMEGVTVVRKGHADIISNGTKGRCSV